MISFMIYNHLSPGLGSYTLHKFSNYILFSAGIVEQKNRQSHIEERIGKTNAISQPICTYFTRWIIPTNSYDLTSMIINDLFRPQWRVGLGAGLGVGHSCKFTWIVWLVNYVWICMSEVELIRTNNPPRKICTNCSEIGL